MSAIEALYIFDEHNNSILEHVYTARPPSAKVLLPLYLAHPSPRPSLIYLPTTNPPTLLYSIIQDRLLFLTPSSTDVEPLLVLEFLHRVADALEEFLGSPLLGSRIESSSDVVAQVLGEMCDAGLIGSTEPNALRDVVEASTWVGKLLGGVGLPSSSPALNASSAAFTLQKPQLNPTLSNSGSAIPWRRSNVRHTSNELYVDIVETLSVTIAPSGRPLSAFANGSIAFTSKVSGVPDLLLTLSAPGGKVGIEKALDLPVFHPCVRLARWRERPGELSFVPPDGRFVLAGYEVDLLPPGSLTDGKTTSNINLPASIEVYTSLGPYGSEFEIRLTLSNRFRTSNSSATSSAASSSLSNTLGRSGGSAMRSTPSPAFGTSATAHSGNPTVEDILISTPIPTNVRNLSDIRPSKGEAHFSPTDGALEWRIPSRYVGTSATLRCTVVGPLTANDAEAGTNGFDFGTNSSTYDYNDDDDAPSTYRSSAKALRPVQPERTDSARDAGRIAQNAGLMPQSATLSFSVKGWLASGIRVESLEIDKKRSRGLGEGVRPYKGVKYLCVSRGGVEVRC
ncbi:Adaptor complexes medium subunit family-domain-containing protein [Cryomyces antarcticus]